MEEYSDGMCRMGYSQDLNKSGKTGAWVLGHLSEPRSFTDYIPSMTPFLISPAPDGGLL